MKIVKYTKKKNGKYQLLLENNETIDTYQNVILKNNLLYKNKLDEQVYEQILEDNQYEDVYNKCIKYITMRLRSQYEIEKYLKNKNLDDNLITTIVEKLKKGKLIDDEKFAVAFVHDKFKFTTMGPHRIKQQLKQHQIDYNIIDNAINGINKNDIYEKIQKLIQKQYQSVKNKNLYLKSKIYNKILNLGYDSQIILEVLNNFKF